MPTTLTALLAAVVHDARAAAANADTVGLDHAAAMLTSAAAGQPLHLERDRGRLIVNGLPMTEDAPGAALLNNAMRQHGTVRIDFPAGLQPADWAAIGMLYASAAALYPTGEHFRAALEGTAPGIAVQAEQDFGIVIDDRTDWMEPSAGPRDEPATDVTSSVGERAGLSLELDPLIAEAHAAVSKRDWFAIAEVVIRMHALETADHDGSRAILVRECRRVVPEMARAGLVRLIAAGGAPPTIVEAVRLLGHDGANALIDAIAADPTRTERRALLEVLGRIEGIDGLIIDSILSPSADLARDMADLAGRRRIDAAVDNLTRQLRHPDESVRTAAWRALEGIGTVEAIEALNRGR
ncbi:MAG TPA: HEAT repeat domain-containing protein [Gemmatimonadales bacterium]|nr:HEAT repeat domain-containing protein [Gemmatimonadales bacterium]